MQRSNKNYKKNFLPAAALADITYTKTTDE